MKQHLGQAIAAACVARAEANELFDNTPCPKPCKWCVAATSAALIAFLQSLPTGLPTAESPRAFRIFSDKVQEEWSDEIRNAAKELLPEQTLDEIEAEKDWVALQRSAVGGTQ